jgi:hypothetical protein
MPIVHGLEVAHGIAKGASDVLIVDAVADGDFEGERSGYTVCSAEQCVASYETHLAFLTFKAEWTFVRMSTALVCQRNSRPSASLVCSHCRESLSGYYLRESVNVFWWRPQLLMRLN